MGYEVSFKIFDGLQNFFWCFSFLILFSNFFQNINIMVVLTQNVQTGH